MGRLEEKTVCGVRRPSTRAKGGKRTTDGCMRCSQYPRYGSWRLTMTAGLSFACRCRSMGNTCTDCLSSHCCNGIDFRWRVVLTMTSLRLVTSHHEGRFILCIPLQVRGYGLYRLPVATLLQRDRRPAACDTGGKKRQGVSPRDEILD